MNFITAFVVTNLILINSGFSLYKIELKLTSSRRGDSVCSMFIHTRKSEGPLRTRHPSRIVFAHCVCWFGVHFSNKKKNLIFRIKNIIL